VVAVAVVCLLVWRHRPPTPIKPVSSSRPSKELTLQTANSSPTPTLNQLPPGATENLVKQEGEREKKLWDLWLATPISFYGKVVDEKNNPVSDANAHISFVDTLGSGSTHTKVNEKTDSTGIFHTSGHGLGVVVMVSKEGYYHLEQSDGNFEYSNAGGQVDPHTDPNNPAVFILRKIGKTEPLIVIRHNYSIGKNGMPVEVNLATGKVAQPGQGNIKVEAWTNDQGHQINSNQPYDWRCRITVPGGGVVQRAGEFDFEAPLDGYAASDEIDMPVNLGQQWRTQASKNYFLMLANGTYARLEFRMIAGGDHFFKITSYLNPQSGYRNLEYGQNQPGTAP